MHQSVWKCVALRTLAALGAVAIGSSLQPIQAATVCVGTASGCQSTISAAVGAAAAGDTIQVAAGTYKEVVTINKPLSLIGAGSATTIIDATGLSNGVIVDGSAKAPNSGVSDVVIAGFTIENANFQGVLVQNASNVTIFNNQIIGNDKSLTIDASGPNCPGLPDVLVAGEAFDCGEGVNLTGVDHSVVSNNVIQNNAGGILISDDTGATHDNVITGNLVTLNAYDCGITLASHSGMGVYHNTISGNTSSSNGLATHGEGAGVGIFAPGPGSKNYGNVVVNNILTGNGMPGVAMHNHAAPPGAPAVSLDDNMIIGNTISGNSADFDDAATPGTTGINIFSLAPVNGVVISQNVISQQSIGLAVNAPGKVVAYLNNFMTTTGINNIGSGSINGSQNYWGCTGGPGAPGACSGITGGVNYAGWLTAPFNGTQLPTAPGGGSGTPGGGGGTGTGVTIVVTGPNGATSSTNTFDTVSNLVVLDASKSTTANGGTLTYSWTASPGFPGVSMTGGNTAKPTVQLQSKGTYQLTLTVTDSTGATATSKVTIQYI
jgi:hypothetical protein